MKTPSKEQITRWLTMVINGGGNLAFNPDSPVELEIKAYFNDHESVGSTSAPFLNTLRVELEQSLLSAYLLIKEQNEKNKNVKELKNALAHAIDQQTQIIFDHLNQLEDEQPQTKKKFRFASAEDRINYKAAIFDSKINLIEWIQESLSGERIIPLSAASKGGFIGFIFGLVVCAVLLLLFATPIGLPFVASMIIAGAIVGSIIGAVGTKIYYVSQAQSYQEEVSFESEPSEIHSPEFQDIMSPHNSDAPPTIAKGVYSPRSSLGSSPVRSSDEDSEGIKPEKH
jgi:hypothetical protein